MNVLASDLDRTLLPNGKWPITKDSIELFNRLIQEHEVFLIYVTGRNLELAQKGVQEYGFIEPNIFITDVGARVWVKKGTSWFEDNNWQEQIKNTHKRWDHKKIEEAVKKVRGVSHQEEENNSLFKQSYYATNKRVVREVKEQLRGLFDEHIIHSTDPLTKKELLDIMPQKVTKLTAIQFIQEKLGVREQNITYCGDSGNDIEPLTGKYRGIVVRNADKELREALEEKQGSQKTYFAQGSKLGNGYYVNGVIEGAYHFGVFKK